MSEDRVKKKEGKVVSFTLFFYGGADGTRTHALRRDRPAL